MSSINTQIPGSGDPVMSAPIRGNFSAAANDIDDLQTQIDALQSDQGGDVTSANFQTFLNSATAPAGWFTNYTQTSDLQSWLNNATMPSGWLSGYTPTSGLQTWLNSAVAPTQWFANYTPTASLQAWLNGAVAPTAWFSPYTQTSGLQAWLNAASSPTNFQAWLNGSSMPSSWGTPGGGGGITNSVLSGTGINVTNGNTANATVNLATPVSIIHGGTGATTMEAARNALGVTPQWINQQIEDQPVDIGSPLTVHSTANEALVELMRGTSFPTSGNVLGTINFQGHQSGSANRGAWIEAIAAGTGAWSATNRTTRMNINVTNGTQPVNAIQIAANGAVGIGQNPPPGAGEVRVLALHIGAQTLRQYIESILGEFI